jgi:hypothetical protein
MWLHNTACCIGVVGIGALSSCAAQGGRGVWQSPGQGTEVNIYLAGPHAKYARWASGPGDELRFAGGSNALQANWSWEGVLTAEQVALIDAVVIDANWLNAAPSGSGPSHSASKGNVWQVTVSTSTGHNAFTVYGHPESVEAVWAVMNEAGRARFARDEALIPKPDLDRYIQSRTHAGTADGSHSEDK